MLPPMLRDRLMIASRRRSHRHAEQREGHGTLARLGIVVEDGLGHRLQPAAGQTLDGPKADRHGQARRQPAGERAHTEAGDAGERNRVRPSTVDSQPERGSTIALVTRQEVRTRVASSGPAARLMGDVLQGDIGDRDVQHLLEGRHGDHGRHQPEARPVRRRSSGGPAHRAWSRRASASPSCACAVVMALRAAPCSASVDCSPPAPDPAAALN